MTNGKCTCGEGNPEASCPACEAARGKLYWCDTCRRAVAEKRCPFCGLKARKLQG